MDLAFSQACENNKKPIFTVIEPFLKGASMILEIGSGTAQHAVYFASKLNDTFWQTSDQLQYHNGIEQRLEHSQVENIGQPLVLDVTQPLWPVERCQGVFSANTCHIMSWPMVEKMFQGVGKILDADTYFCLYGPFNFGGHYSSPSNASFDGMLRNRDPKSGLRHFEDLQTLATKHHLRFVHKFELPANNCILVWQKCTIE